MTSYKGKIGVSDITPYDGKNRTFTRQTSTGGSLTVPRIGNIVDVLAVYGDGTTPAEADLLEAIANIGTTEACLELAPGSWPITANLTPASNFTFRLRRGAVFTVSTGITLNLSSCMVFPEEATWTAGAGTVTTVPENVNLPGAFHKLLVTTNDTTPNFLASKLVAGTNITLTASGAGNETLTAAGSTSPTIASFANATHAHTSAATGGTVGFISGDGTTGLKIGVIGVTITDATDAAKIKVTSADIYNASDFAQAVTDNIAKDDTSTNFYLSASGLQLRVGVASGKTVEAVIAARKEHDTTAIDYFANVTWLGSYVVISLAAPGGIIDSDLTSIVDAGEVFYVVVTFLYA